MRPPTRRNGNQHILELLERRVMLSRAVDAAVSPLDVTPAARFAPAGKSLWKSGGYLTKPVAGQPADIALGYFRTNAAAFGITAADIGTPLITSQYTDADTGMTHIYWRQQVNGLEIGNADANATVARDGRVLSINSAFIPGVATVLAGKKIVPGLSATTAVLRAAGNLGISHRAQPTVAQALVGSAMIGKLRSAELSRDDIATRLRYVVAPDGPRLAWNFILNLPSGEHWYDTSVDANSGALLWTADWTSHDDFGPGPADVKQTTIAPAAAESAATSAGSPLVANYNATYNVFPYPLGKNPDTAPRSLVTNPWDLTASPFGWQDTNGDANPETTVTAGNNVAAQEDLDGSNATVGVQPAATGTATNQTYDFPLNLANAPSTYTSAATVNLYYWNNIIHDIHYRYGFTEAAGNFQLNNYGNGGAANDRVNADAQDGGGTNNANFSTPVDGSSGRMQMYVWNYASPSRDGDFDAPIIIHEYGHGVSTRLTGGPANSSSLNQLQSGGMGEGWGDWWALMLLQTDGSAATLNGAIPVAQYSVGMNATSPGLRRYPYSFDKSIDPMTFTMFNQSTEVHATGEIWTSTLWDMAVLLEKKYGFNSNIQQGFVLGDSPNGKGNLLAMRLVMDALKLQPSNPTLVQARDAILQADTALNSGADFREIWAAFARRGLGSTASTTGSSSSSLTLGWDMPAGLAGNPPIVTHSTPMSGNNFTNLSSVTFQFSLAMNPATFTTAADINFTGPGGSNLNAQITGGVWSNGNKTLTVSFNAQSTDGTYTMTVGPNIAVGGAATLMDQDFDGVAGEASDSYTATITLDKQPGPDAANYSATTTAFQNINLATGGGTLLLDNQDDTSGSISLGAGNTFRFYGVDYNQVFVNENGLITFGSGSTAYNNGVMTFSPPQAMIAVLFDDWATDTTAADKVLYKLDIPNKLLTIEWSAITNRGDFNAAFDTNPGTFQAILSLNTGSNPGEIVLNYVDLDVGPASSPYSTGGSATVGIKAAGTQGANGNNNRLLLSMFNNPNTWLASSSAIRISAVATATVAGRAFQDNNGDGVQSGAGEVALSNVTVYADANGNSTLDGGESSALTNGTGDYTLTSVPAGAITIRETVPANYVVTNASIGAVNLGGGQTLNGISFGNFPTSYTGSSMILRLDGAGTKVQVWVNDTTINPPTYTADKTLISTVGFTGTSGNDSLTVDTANGNPVPAGAISFNGLTNTVAGDTLILLGRAAVAETLTTNSSNATFAGGTINETSVENVRFDGKGGSDVVTNNGGGPLALFNTQHLASLTTAASTVTSVDAGGANLLVTATLSIAGTSFLDLNDNDMIVNYSAGTPLATVVNLIKAARNSGAWDLAGITSSIAKSNGNHDTGLGAIEATDYKTANVGATTFDGEPIDNTAVLVKYTYYGDTDFNGKVDGADYARVDGRFNQQVTLGNIAGWFNGDFDYNGKIDGSDYALIDSAFNSQDAPL